MAAGNERSLTINIHEKRDGNALVQAARDLEQLARGADVAGDKLAGTATDLEKLDAQMKRTQLRIKDLSAQIVRTGDTSLFGDLRKEEADLRRLTRLAKNLAEEVPEAGAKAAKGFMDGFDSAMSATGPFKPIIYGTLIGAAIAAAPTIVSVIGGAVAGGIGTVGVAGGIFMASRDPGVRAAAEQFGKSVSESFFGGGDAFVRPVERSLAHLASVVDGLDLEGTFAKAAPSVERIAVGLGKMAENSVPGLNAALERMNPFADAAAEGFADLGTAFSGFLDDVTRSEGTVEALEVGFRIVSNTVTLLGKAIYYASEAFAVMNAGIHVLVKGAVVLSTLGGPLAGFRDQLVRIDAEMEDLRHQTAKTHTEFGPAEAALKRFGTELEDAAGDLKIFNEQMNGAYNQMMNLAGAEISAEAALDQLTDGIKEHGASLDIDTEAGRDNTTGLIRFAEAAEKAREETLKQTGSVDAANAKYAEYRERLKETLTQLTGNAQLAEELTNKWLGLAALPPLNLVARLNIIAPANIPMDVWMAKLDPDMARASGGPVTAGQPYMVGEQGPELFVPRQNGSIVASGAALAAAGGGGRGGTQTIRVEVGGTPSSALERMFVEWMFGAVAKEVGVRGGELEVLNFKRPR